MPGKIELAEVTRSDEIPTVRSLFQEYASQLGVDLCFQGFDEELASLPVPYIRPQGFIFLAKEGGIAAGCIALKPLDSKTCEMKRLYVRPEFRGLGLGRELVLKCLEQAERIGYEKMRLDTLQQMSSAQSLYRSIGFVECDPYYDNPLEGVVYMERTLGGR